MSVRSDLLSKTVTLDYACNDSLQVKKQNKKTVKLGCALIDNDSSAAAV